MNDQNQTRPCPAHKKTGGEHAGNAREKQSENSAPKAEQHARDAQNRETRAPEPYVPDANDRKILDIIQTGFPLEARPYAVIGAAVGLSEAEVFKRVGTMRESGHIRRMGANFDSQKLGFKSTLCAAKVPEDKLADFIREVNAHPGVTHNYLRDHEYNVWFTVIDRDMNAISRVVDEIAEKTGIRALNLPATAIYKIRVDFPLEREENDENPNPGI